MISLFDIDPVFKHISIAVEREKCEAYVIGGFVRDIFLGRESKDIDIVCVGNGIALAHTFAGIIKATEVSVYKNFGTAMVKYRHNEQTIDIEFVGTRKESYSKNSRKPEVQSGTLQDDQNRRDFTINTVAISLNNNNFGEILDPFNGINDIRNSVIRTPLNPDITYSDDPLRMMRAIRFASQLNFTIEENSFNAIKFNAQRIEILSKERITEEINKILLSPKPSIGFNLLEKSTLLKIIFPEILKLKGIDVLNGHGHKDVFYHTLKVLDNLAGKTSNIWLMWAALLHDIAKPDTKKYIEGIGWSFHSHEAVGSKKVPKIFSRLKLPLNEKMKYVQKLVYLHLRPQFLSEDGVTDSAIRRLLFEAGEDIDDLLLLCEADITSSNEQKVEQYLHNFKLVRHRIEELEKKDFLRTWQPPITGEHIMNTFDIQPSKQVGVIKNAVRDAILDGYCSNSFEAAYNFMLEQGALLGLKIKQ